jgi:pimeloyl-ACP methyl ester carboxylesterase/mannose-6-phosphate isomerase-like protein (cupin superfamily)
MTKASVTGPGGGEVIRLGPTTMRILEDGSTTAHRLGMGEITVAPHSDGPTQHRHARHDEGFYVVSGTARFTVGTETYDAPAGSLAMIPPGAPHTFANHGDEPLVLLNTFTPDLYVHYFRDLRAMIEQGGTLTPEATQQVMSRYATEPATTYADDPATSTYQVPTSFGEIPVTVTQRGQGRPVLLLHGGAGPDSVAGFADRLAERFPVQVLTPAHPGFGDTPRPGGLDSARKLGELYRNLLGQLGLTGVTVVGSSIGGWIAAELALSAGERAARLILLDAVGLDSADHPVADYFSMTLDQVFDISFAHPDRYRIDPATLTDEQRAVAAGNRAALEVYGGRSMTDPGLAARLAGITVPTLVVWGEADRMVTPAYGREFAAAIPAATFRVLPDAGHLPQIEAPETLLALLGEFTGDTPAAA